MPWFSKQPDLKNNPLYLEPRVTAAETQLASNSSKLGDLTQLNTTDKTSVVNALKEVKTQANANASAVNSIGSATPKGTYATLSALQTAFPAGATGIYLVTADGGWYYWSGSAWAKGGTYQSTGIADDGVNLEKLEALVKADLYSISTKNLYNPYKRKVGYTDCLNNFTASGAVSSTDKIAVAEGETVYFSKNGASAIVQWVTPLKADGSPYATTANQIQWATIYTVPAGSGITHIIASFDNTYVNFAVSKGSLLNPYETYYSSKLTSMQNTLNTYPTPNDIARLMLNKNLFNKATAVNGSFINWTNGIPQANADFWYSDYIEVLASTAYVQTAATYAAEYDVNKAFIKGYQMGNKTFTTSATTKYVRVSLNPITSKDSFQFEKGTVSTAYVPYSYTIKDTNNSIPVLLPNTAPNHYKGKIMVTYGDSITEQAKWQSHVVNKFELGSFINKGVGGRLVAWNSGMNMDDQIATLPDASAMDFLAFMGGTNDWANNVPLGSITDTTNGSFYGALNVMTQKLIVKYPTKRIIFMTTPYGGLYASGTFTDGGYVNTLGLTTHDYAKCVKAVAEKFGFPCVDVYSNAGWNRHNITNYITDDGGYLHPNDNGGKRIAELLIGKLKDIEPIA